MTYHKTELKGSVLIVDDIPENLQVVGNILMKKGLDIGFATSGQEALENVAYNKPDLILLDIMMPGMNGMEVCRKLKADPTTADIPVIFLTAKAQSDDVITGFEIGAIDYITKPFNSGELLARVMTQIELKNSRDTIHLQNQELRELNATKDKFFSIIAHDLRGPFTGLLGLTELILDESESMPLEEILNLNKMIQRSLKNQYNLLDNLLQWASMQSGRIEFNPIKLDLFRMVADIFNQLMINVEDKKIVLDNSVPPDTYISADRMMLRTIIHNLITNAIKFTPEGGSVTLFYYQDDRYDVVVCEDTGVGMSEDIVAKIFRIDQHHTSLGTKNEKGTGLGLILCSEMAGVHGGKIEVESKPGVGTKFMVKLPII
ncbi:MAG: response regulator [Candidatus Kapaibacterium sp.]